MFLGQKVHYYMIYTTYYTELNLQICNYAQKWLIFCENSKYEFDKICMAIFALAERLPTSLTLPRMSYFWQNFGVIGMISNVPQHCWSITQNLKLMTPKEKKVPPKKPEANLGQNRLKSAVPVMQKMHARGRRRARGLIFFSISSELKFRGNLP